MSSGSEQALPSNPIQPASSGFSEKPTQVVSPAINRSQQNPVTPKSNNTTPKTAVVSPAIATIERLLSLGSITPPPVPIITHKPGDMDPHMIEQLKSVKDLLSIQEEESRKVKELNVELQERLDDYEIKIKKLTEQNEEYVEKEKKLTQKVTETVKNNRQMSVVMQEYEGTISSLIGEREQERRRWSEERATLVRERDEAAAHLASMEHSFNDVHTKYERCKVVIQGYKSNEESLKQTVAENDDTIKKLETRYDTLRQHAMMQLNKANQELDNVKKAHQSEITKLNAMLKKSEIHATSLQESLAQKLKDNEELTAICDELINKVV